MKQGFCLIKKLRLLLIFIACISFLFNSVDIAFAQDGNGQKKNAFQIVLGREATNKEKDAYLNLEKPQKIEALKNDLLPREQQLVVVRALLAVGEAEHSKKILELVHFSEVKTYSDLVDEFQKLKNSYGSVLLGIESNQKYKLSEGEIFKRKAGKAYEEVFCVSLESLSGGEQTRLLDFFKGVGVTQFDEMIKALVESMTDDDKKNIIFRALDEVDREDLKANEEFINKMISQKFTCKTLRKLFEQLRG